MELNEFVKNFAAEFEMTAPEEITPETVYRDLDEWDSLIGLSIIGMVSNTYSVKITGEEVKNAGTVEGLFKIVASRK